MPAQPIWGMSAQTCLRHGKCYIPGGQFTISDTSPDPLDAERLALERERMQLEARRLAFEVRLKRRELARPRPSVLRDLISNPLAIAFVGGFITLMTQIITSRLNESAQRLSDTNRANQARETEERQAKAAREAEARTLQAELIKKFAETPDLATARDNLEFLINAGLLPEYEERIRSYLSLNPGSSPRVGTSNADAAKSGADNVLKNPAICNFLDGSDFKGRARPLDDADLDFLSRRFDLEIPLIKAFSRVESTSKGFIDGRPVILFERHIFSRRTGGQFDSSDSDISNPVPGGYGAPGAYQYDRLRKAMRLDCQTALEATSWGAAQILGFNYKQAGFGYLDDFILFEMDSERNQFEATFNGLENHGTLAKLRSKAWAEFAFMYNGANFKNNGYDKKLQNIYEEEVRIHQ